MAGFSSYDDMINKMVTNGQSLEWHFTKTGTAMQGAGFWHRTWIAAGSPVAAAAEPAATPGAALTSNANCMNWANQSPSIKTLLTFGAVATNNCTLMLFDRLSHVGALSSASTGSKTVSSSALGRYTGGTGVQAWLECTTASTTTQAICHLLSYTGDVNGAGQVGGSFTWPAAATVKDCMMGPLPLASGDKGVVAVSTINIDTANTAGVFNLVLLKPLAYLPLIANQWNERDLVLQLASMPQVFDGASLGVAIMASAAAATTVYGKVGIGYG
jgi:hypothetical protein